MERESLSIRGEFHEAVVLLTGVTGFVGGMLLEQLLRCTTVRVVPHTRSQRLQLATGGGGKPRSSLPYGWGVCVCAPERLGPHPQPARPHPWPATHPRA
jgi:hypothetical protein